MENPSGTKAMEDLYAVCPNVPLKIGDVEIDQNFFMQDKVSHSVIMGGPFIMASHMETKVLDSGVVFARIWIQLREKSV